MLSPCRASILSNARTLLLNRRYTSSIAVTSRSNVFATQLQKNLLRSNSDNSSFQCFQQRGLRTKSKNSDAMPHNSYSGDKDNKSEEGTGPGDFRRVSFGVHKMSLEEFKLFKEKEFKQFLREKNPNITDEEIDEIVAKSRRKVRVIQINVSYVRYVFLGIVAYLAYVMFTFLERKRAKFKGAPSQTGSLSTGNAPFPPATESNFEKKELKTGNEFDLNALFPTAAESDSIMRRQPS